MQKSRSISPSRWGNKRKPDDLAYPTKHQKTSPISANVTPQEAQRELDAKAKRLVRFNVELSQEREEGLHDVTSHKGLGNKQHHTPLGKTNADNPAEVSQDLVNGIILPDFEGVESSSAVVGLCPYMCPESEREERERKGDLDKYERVDGDRNQTNASLAVKKYNRTAEREADLIRPMPVLQMTVDYLLHRLDQSYSDDFLSIYNFLWDRMRAIRMDLRMQHIFNREAIIMLEQMIRLHIIAMHELCEYKKGVGFSEGFDAHLNIEQMNKTSAELFQLYDDHRKKGDSVETEQEFRGYYALLKLDKHPGFKVEPAELSLELAKMTPEIRCSQEILFAREVARSCRLGNYIAFFRHARKATYLESCLMHAHFAKVRRQALASLHSGLQNNQGIPIEHIVKWLGMEGGNVQGLVEHHGFVVKKYGEPYMVKQGPFLSMEIDFPIVCSQLVRLKKSRRIINDVCHGPTPLRATKEAEASLPVRADLVDYRGRTSPLTMVDEEMVVLHEAEPALLPTTPPKQPHQNMVDRDKIKQVYSPRLVDDYPSIHVEDEPVLESDLLVDERSLMVSDSDMVQAVDVLDPAECMIMDSEDPRQAVVLGKSSPDNVLVPVPRDQEKTAIEKLKQILRRWKQQASRLKVIRKQRALLNSAALSSLSLGPPICITDAYPRCPPATGYLNIDSAIRERQERLEKSWSILNVSELVASVLSARNPDARCIFWKMAVFIQADGTESRADGLASRWLLLKLRGKGGDDGLVVTSPSSHFSIWRKWMNTCDRRMSCLSIVREAMFDDNKLFPRDDDALAGISSIMFYLSETIPLETQKSRLHNLMGSIPPGSNLPLLVVSIGATEEGATDIISGLGLHKADATKISCFSLISLVEKRQFNGFFSDDQLRESLKWLAAHSPLQPDLCKVGTHELVSGYLRASTIYDPNNDQDVGPDRCISTFNEALDRVEDGIISSASISWPCPEIHVLEESTVERAFAELLSRSTRIEPLIAAISECKLPSFPNMKSLLSQGFEEADKIREQKIAIKECLFEYLTRSSELLNAEFAEREAELMLLNCADLVLRGTKYHIVPRWRMIFQRIYNWRLMNLADREFSVYVLSDIIPPSIPENELFLPVRPHLNLDEMIEACCPVPRALTQPFSRPLCSPSGMKFVEQENGDAGEICCIGRCDENGNNGDDSVNNDGDNVKSRGVSDVHTRRFVESCRDRLNALFQQCNKIQDMIDNKLSLYF